MDMTLSKRGDYVMRSAISLGRAFEQGTAHKIREIVAETEVPRTFASQILADLVRAGLAVSKAGRDGGYRLARPPSEISVLEVIEAAEGPLRAERCALGDGPCRWEAVCPLHETWSEATGALRELLSGTTLAEVAARDAAIEAGTYAIPPDSHRSHPVTIDVSDVVHVELGLAALHGALARCASSLGTLIAAAAEEGPADADPDGRTPSSTRRLTAEASLAPSGPSIVDPSGRARYLLAWQLDGAPGEGSRFEGELSVAALDDERSEVRAEGNWRQAPGAGPLGAPDLERQARSNLRSFLRHLARVLEEEPRRSRSNSSPLSVTLR